MCKIYKGCPRNTPAVLFFILHMLVHIVIQSLGINCSCFTTEICPTILCYTAHVLILIIIIIIETELVKQCVCCVCVLVITHNTYMLQLAYFNIHEHYRIMHTLCKRAKKRLILQILAKLYINKLSKCH